MITKLVNFWCIIVFMIFFACSCFGQEKILKSTFENIQYVEDLKMYDDDIYCAGYSFKTAINDGNSSDAYLVNYEKSTLKVKWSTKISGEHSNKINSIIKVKDKIYALVTQGKISSSTEDVHLSLFIIKLNGEIEETVNFGPSFSRPSNIIINDKNLYFGYQAGNNITYADNDLRSVILNYNLETKKITKFKSSQYFTRPEKILLNKSDVYLSGTYIHPNQSNLLFYKNKVFSKLSFKSKKTEYFLDNYINGKILTVVCTFPGAYKDMNQYLKFYYINLENNNITSKTITYKDLGWSDIRFDIFSTDSSTWLYVQDAKSKMFKYVLIDNKGKVIKTLVFDYGSNYTQKIIIDNDTLICTSEGSIKIKQKLKNE